MRLSHLLTFLAAFAATCAAETRTLYELALRTEFRSASWVTAMAQIEASPELPPGVKPADGLPGQSVAVTLRWPGKDFQFCNLEPRHAPRPIPFAVSEVSLHVRGSNTGQVIEACFADANGKELKLSLGTLKFADWKRLSAKVPPAAAQPLTFKNLTFHNYSSRETGVTSILLSRLEVTLDPAKRLRAPAPPVLQLLHATEGGIAADDGKAGLYCTPLAWDSARAFELRYRITDWLGNSVGTGSAACNGDQTRRLDIALPAFGSYAVAVDLHDPAAGKVIASANCRIARIVPVPKLSAGQRLSSPIGINTHLGAPWELFGRLGIHWARDYAWSFLDKAETAPLGRGMSFADFYSRADSAGVTVLPCLMGMFRNPAGAAFISDSAAISAIAARLAKAFPQVTHWELDNEADYGFPGRVIDEANYVNLIRSFSAGLRSAGSKAQVALNGTAGIHYEATRSLVKTPAVDHFDIVNYHYYTGKVPPELANEDINVGGEDRQEPVSFLDQLRRINQVARSAGKQAWLTEVGWDVINQPAVSEELQAAYLPRVFMLAMACGTDKVFWYYDRDVPNSKTRFGTSGLIDLNGDLRPSAAAMAALSNFTAQAKFDGTIDLGLGLWCVLFKQPDGSHIAAAWSVRQSHPLPRDLAGVKAFDLFGNPVQLAQITPHVAYFALPKLPNGWDAQRQTQWAGLGTILTSAGQPATARIRCPERASKATWAGMPAGVKATAWQREGDDFVATVTPAADFIPGSVPLGVTVEGATWRRQFEPVLSVIPAVSVSADAYTPGELLVTKLRTKLDKPVEVLVQTKKTGGSVLPGVLTVEPGTEAKLAFLASPEAKGVVPLVFKLPNNVEHTHWLRPTILDIPRIQKIDVDGDLKDWPAASRLDSRCFTSGSLHFPVEAYIASSDAGIHIAARIAVTGLQPADPQAFWDGANLELFLDTSGPKPAGWSKSTHQFFFCPVKRDGQWHLSAGEWKRGDAIPATIHDDPRCKTAIRVEAGSAVYEAFIPLEALNGLKPAGTWRALLSLRIQDETTSSEGAWPRAKANVINTPEQWGTIRFGM